MTHRSLALALAAVGIAATAPVANAATRATVLGVDRTAKTVRVVNARQQARTFKVVGAIPRAAHTGSRIAFTTRKGRATHVRVLGTYRSLHIRGTIVKASNGALRVQLADGRVLRFGNVVVNLVGFAPGQRVKVDVQISAGGEINVTITLLAHHDEGDCTTAHTCPLHVEGHVTAIDADAGTFTVDPGVRGTAVEFTATAEQLATIAVGDDVDVAAHENASGAKVADRIRVHHEDGPDTDTRHADVFGVVQAIGDTSFTIGRPAGDDRRRETADAGDGTLEITASAEILAGIHVGELVHAVVHRDGDHAVADSVTEVVLPPASLTVVARVLSIADGAIVIGNPGEGDAPARGLTLAATAEQEAGLVEGDLVRVTAHRTGPEQWTADTIVKLTPPPLPPDTHVVDGWLVRVGDTSFDVQHEHDLITVQATPDQLAALAGDVLVHIVAHEDGDALVADTIAAVHAPSFDLFGEVVEVAVDSLTIHTPQRNFAIAATADQLDGIVAGDHVAVHVHMTGPNVFVADILTVQPTA